MSSLKCCTEQSSNIHSSSPIILKFCTDYGRHTQYDGCALQKFKMIDYWNVCHGKGSILEIQSTHVISRQLGAKIRERELSGSPVISHFCAKVQTRDFQDQSPTLWRLHLLNPNSMLSDNGCTYISRISADVDIAPAIHHNKPYYILIIMHQKLLNYTLHKAAYDGIYAETIQTTMRFDRKRK